MRKTFLVTLIIASVLLSGCSNYNNELEELKNENESLKAKLAEAQMEIEELKFGAEKLYKEGEEYFNSGQLYEARHAFNLLLEKHPTSKEAEIAKSILDNIEDTIKKEQEARELAERQQREKKEAEEKQRIANATKNMRTKYDEVKEITWHFDKASPKYDDTKNFLLYIGKDKNNDCWLRLRIRYAADDWLFIKKYILKIDDYTYTILPGDFNVQRDNSGGRIWEWYDKTPSKSDIEAIKAIINSKKTILRYEGDQYHYDRNISQQEKQSLQNVLDAYIALGGSFDIYD